MRVFIAGLDTETNTFSPIPTGLRCFAECLLAHGDGTRRPLNHCSAQLAVWRRMSEAHGYDAIESLCAVAEPGGITNREVYERFRAEILSDLRAASPIDVVLIALHGAMVAEGYDDVEGDLLSNVRAVVGEHVPIGAELDLHCHLTHQMTCAATALVLYKQYPHTDIEERAMDLFRIITDAALKRIRPVMAVYDCRMIGSFQTQEQPLRGFVERMTASEGRENILSVSFAHGFPWGDVADVGARMLVIAHEDLPAAEALAATLGQEVLGLRDRLVRPLVSIDHALDRALQSASGPIVLADCSDNPGGGAPGDATFVIRRILERGIGGAASALHWDPVAVRFCSEAGEGATLDLRIGGKTGPMSGTPLDLRVTVRRIASGLTQRFAGASTPIGDAVWVQGRRLDLILNSQRTQVFSPECFTGLGLAPQRYRFLVVKSTNHFYTEFAPITKEVIFVDAPGALRQRFDEIPYTKLRHPYWPKVENPFG